MNDTSTHPPEPAIVSWGAPPPATPVAGDYAVPVSRPQRRFGGRWLLLIAIGALLFVAPTVMSSLSNGQGISLGGSSGGTDGQGSSGANSSSLGDSHDYSSYYNENLDGNSYSSRWKKDGTFHTESGAYDGPYDYSGYGVDGMKARARGAGVDPLYTDGGTLPDVFDQYGLGSADPLNGAPATARGNAKGPNPVNPYYDPWAARYQNPYQNRLDLSFGSASSRSAWLDGTDPGAGGY